MSDRLIPFTALLGATLLTALYWVLGARTGRGRIGRLAVAVPVCGLALWLALYRASVSPCL